MQKIIKYSSLNLICFLFLLSGIVSPAHGQNKSKKNYAVVNIFIEDGSLVSGSTVKISTIKSGINSNSTHLNEVNVVSKVLNSRSSRLIVPLTNEYTYGNIDFNSDSLNSKPEFNWPINSVNNLFIFQPGDTVTLHITNQKNGVWFTGKSAQKYNCLYTINNHNTVSSNSEADQYYRNHNYEGGLLAVKKQRDSLYNVKLRILMSYKSRLDPKVYQLTRIDCWAEYNHQFIDFLFISPFAMSKRNLIGAYKKMFLRQYGNFKEPFFTDAALMAGSYKYCDFLLEKEKAYAVIINSNSDSSYYKKLKFKDIYQSINDHYKNGLVKDKVKLLSFLTLDKRRQQDFGDFIDDAIKTCGENIFKGELISFKNINTVGVKAFNFNLTDKNGKRITLSDFKGKIVVMDFWFTGCIGCLQMASTLKPITPLFAAHTEIAFLSVCVDGIKKKDSWLSTLKEGKYSSNDEVNLLTDEPFESSEIVKHYKITDYPTLIIISKEGTILSTTPPDPRLNEEAFKKFILKNIN